MASKPLHLEGKDWFTEAEAAEYCGVALSTFREGYRSFGIVPKRFMGKKLYSRSDLFQAIDRSAPWEPSQASHLHLGRVAISPSVLDQCPNLRAIRLRPYKARKKKTSD